MKSSDQGNILAIKLFDPGSERINWWYGSVYPLKNNTCSNMGFINLHLALPVFIAISYLVQRSFLEERQLCSGTVFSGSKR